MEKKNKKVIERIDEQIKNLKNKDFTIFFFTGDSKNIPTGQIVYEYNLALTLKELGYDVKMLYQVENELTPNEVIELQKKGKFNPNSERYFTGVGNWLGEEYSKIEHININKENSWKVSASDFLIIPEAFYSLMFETYRYKTPCKRIVLLENYKYITDFIPIGIQWLNYGIKDCIAISNKQANRVKNVMPYVETNIIEPYIPDYFNAGTKAKKLVISVVVDKESDANKFIKTFYWKYPNYRFVSFKVLHNLNRKNYAEQLKESAISVWIDYETPFGFGGLESIRSGNIVIGKIPETLQDWMLKKEDELNDSIIWFRNTDELPDIFVNVLEKWLNNEIPQFVYEGMKKLNAQYTKNIWDENVKKCMEKYVDDRIEEFEEVKNNFKNKEEE